MRLLTVSTLVTLALLTACSGIPRRDGEESALARYAPYMGEPISQFSMYTRYDGWSPVDDDHVLIHTNVNEAYMLRVAPVCMELPFATRLGITTRFSNTVQSGFDSIRVGRETCRILEIRPVNYRQMKADLAAEETARKKLRG